MDTQAVETPQKFRLTAKQEKARDIAASEATHVLLVGGSRSGKTFEILREIIIRALMAPYSRHAVMRFRFNHVKQSVCLDTFPKVMRLCFPDVEYHMDKTEWYTRFANNAQIWFGGLDDKDRTEKILGQEYVTIFLNECSQIPYSSRNIAMTRLAQKVELAPRTLPDGSIEGPRMMRRKCYYDENPPSKAHWSYKLFIKHVEPTDGKPIEDVHDYAWFQMNPADNLENLPDDYIKELERLPARLRIRFLKGIFADANEGAYWTQETIDKWRVTNVDELPDMVRLIIPVDPSGASDDENKHNDDIGIGVMGLGTDGVAYAIEDLTVNAGPATWGRVIADAYDRHGADRVIGEINYGGAMVEFVIQTARPRTPYEAVTASRGKHIRAEPVASLAEQGKVRIVGNMHKLEEELCGFTKAGYMGEKSPNRADWFIWGVYALFPNLTKKPRNEDENQAPPMWDRETAEVQWLAS
jgi:phage terminase large subunit-like protein